MNPVSADTVIQQLRWRYATKKFDPTRKIPPHDWAALEQALILTPSSFGLQPWRFVVVTDQAIKDQLVPLSYHQRQVADASHTLVLTIRQKVSHAEIEHHVARTAEVRGVPIADLERYKHSMVKVLTTEQGQASVDEWATRQVYIALGTFMTAAALMGIDTCPMEGLQPKKYDDLLGLTSTGYTTILACPAGYRAPDDKYATTPKVRHRDEHVIVRK